MEPYKPGHTLGLRAGDKVVGMGNGLSLGVLEGRRGRGSFTISRLDAVKWLRTGQLTVKQLKQFVLHAERPALLVVERDAIEGGGGGGGGSGGGGTGNADFGMFGVDEEKDPGAAAGKVSFDDEEEGLMADIGFERDGRFGSGDAYDDDDDNDGSGGGNGVLGIGDECTWKGADEDVPRGTVGTVVALHEDGDVEVSFPAPRSRGGGSNVSPFLRNIACLFACATDSSTISATDRPFFCFVYTVLLLQLFDGFAMSVCCCCSLYPLARS